MGGGSSIPSEGGEEDGEELGMVITGGIESSGGGVAATKTLPEGCGGRSCTSSSNVRTSLSVDRSSNRMGDPRRCF